jgi:TonB family protein
MSRLSMVFVSVLFGCVGVFGQEVKVSSYFGASPDITITGLPILKYPADSLKAGVGGRVTVAVVVDEKGRVESATFGSGPGAVCGWVTDGAVAALRNVSVEAARQLKFAPASAGDTIREKLSGWIYFDFVVHGADKKDKDRKESFSIDKPTVPGDSSAAGDNLPKIKAINIEQPSYPAAARAVRVSGQVRVQVLLDEQGNVHSAEAITGNALLQSAAVTAACKSKFYPTFLSGQPVKASGIIVYNFTGK